ncbi:DUF6916 family protein [Nocardioides stalactiti]|uniref:DUF6916 family protein n=1 Tax=Nocardioides stalactiti TaxID=2755356 RepID=UPI0016003581|nr:hypothetical protein [Nocardioides stalactiti]
MAETGFFTYDDFADRVGEEFRVVHPDAVGLTLVLSSVTGGEVAGGAGPDGTERRQFSLVFRGPTDPQLSQGTWELDHDAINDLALFLVPLGPDTDGPRYEAVFA